MKIFDQLFLFGICLFFFVSMISFSIQAKPGSECPNVIQQLHQMKVAQVSVQDSLVSNHELMAQSLESYSEALSDSAGKAHGSISQNMAKAAGSLRERALKAQTISKRLEINTDELVKSVEKCLKQANGSNLIQITRTANTFGYKIIK